MYPAACLGIVYSPVDHTQRHFSCHARPVLAIAVFRELDLVATAEEGENAPIYVWNAATMETLSRLPSTLRFVCIGVIMQ